MASTHHPCRGRLSPPRACAPAPLSAQLQRGWRVPRLHELDRARARQRGKRADGRSGYLIRVNLAWLRRVRPAAAVCDNTEGAAAVSESARMPRECAVQESSVDRKSVV